MALLRLPWPCASPRSLFSISAHSPLSLPSPFPPPSHLHAKIPVAYLSSSPNAPCRFSTLSLLLNSRNSHVAATQTSPTSHVADYRHWSPGGGLVHESAKVDPSAYVAAGAVVLDGAVVGPNSHVGAGSVVGSNVALGSDCVLGLNVSLQHCTVGDRCTLHNGVCIGQDGFGFFVTETGEVKKKPQTLSVRVGNDVEVGANSCIDRGSWRDTVIGDSTKLDNLVQIGHNVVMGKGCMLCGQVGVAGSATLGDYVVLAGQVGVADHVSIASKVRVAAKSGVITSISSPGDYAGFPAVPAHEWRRAVVLQRKLGRSGTSDS